MFRLFGAGWLKVDRELSVIMSPLFGKRSDLGRQLASQVMPRIHKIHSLERDTMSPLEDQQVVRS